MKAEARRRAGWALSGLGLAVIVGATLWVASAGYGTRVRRGFEERRSYDTVKPAVQRVAPWAVLTGVSGLVLMVVGTRLRR